MSREDVDAVERARSGARCGVIPGYRSEAWYGALRAGGSLPMCGAPASVDVAGLPACEPHAPTAMTRLMEIACLPRGSAEEDRRVPPRAGAHTTPQRGR